MCEHPATGSQCPHICKPFDPPKPYTTYPRKTNSLHRHHGSHSQRSQSGKLQYANPNPLVASSSIIWENDGILGMVPLITNLIINGTINNQPPIHHPKIPRFSPVQLVWQMKTYPPERHGTSLFRPVQPKLSVERCDACVDSHEGPTTGGSNEVILIHDAACNITPQFPEV